VQLNELQIGFVLSVSAIADLATRLTFHSFTEKLNISNKISFLFGIVGFSILKCFLGNLIDFYSFIGVCFAMGVFKSFINVHYLLVISEFCSKTFPRKLSSALSLSLIVNTFFILIFGQLLGLSRMINESYVLSFYLENLLVLVVFIVWICTY
jgi:hypothetical protein